MIRLILICLACLAACTSPSPDESKSLDDKQNARISVKVIDVEGLDGCKYLLETSDGRRLQATNLSSEYQKAGLELQVLVKPAKNMMSICMAGEMVELVEVKTP